MTSAGLVSGRAVVLITGMSGTGKSTVLQQLALRGHRVVDTDVGGWIVGRQNSQGEEPVWDLDRVHALLDAHQAGWLFVAGCVANQGMIYHRFDRIVLLSAPIDVVLARVQSRTNPYGSTAEDRARIAEDLTAFEPLLRARADHEIITTAPPAAVVAAVEQVAAGSYQSAVPRAVSRGRTLHTGSMTDTAGVETTPPADNGGDKAADVTSDPAKDDTQGQDWSDEGGATPSGPATDTDGSV